MKAAWPRLAMLLPGMLAPGAVGLALQDTGQAVSATCWYSTKSRNGNRESEMAPWWAPF